MLGRRSRPSVPTVISLLSATINRGTGLGSCPATTQVRVTSTRWSEAAAPANTDHGFFIWFEAG